jgi:uncharacterized protein (TIGR02588 family)
MPETRSKPAKKPVPFLERTPILEWLMAALGLVAAIGSIGYLTWEGVQGDERSPILTVSARGVTATPRGYIVDVEVINQSRATASSVQVEGALPAVAGPEEVVALTFDYVAGKGRREGSMTFLRDPRGQALRLQVKGQIAP